MKQHQMCGMIYGKPLVSVVVTTYKRPEFLERAISSVLQQTYEALELIVVDDNDKYTEYREAVQRLMSRYLHRDNVKYIPHDHNKGVSAARNSGIFHASGELVAFLDDDDEWLPEKLEKQVEKYLDSDDPHLAVVCCGWKIVSPNGRKMNVKTPGYRGNLDGKICLNIIGPPSMVLCRKEAALRVGGFDECLQGSREDADFYLRLSREFNFDYIVDALLVYYMSDDSLSRNVPRIIEAYELFWDKHAEYIKSSAWRHKEYLERLGDLNIECNRKRRAVKCFRDAISLAPGDHVVKVKLLGSVMGARGYFLIRFFFRKFKEIRSTFRRVSGEERWGQ